jgi:hypothetical protein
VTGLLAGVRNDLHAYHPPSATWSNLSDFAIEPGIPLDDFPSTGGGDDFGGGGGGPPPSAGWATLAFRSTTPPYCPTACVAGGYRAVWDAQGAARRPYCCSCCCYC